MYKWLQNFAYRIDITWWFFLLPLLLVMLTTVLTVSSQVLKTANVNPAESLRHE
jgi:putative ABC transport system permease protein